jgi:hypothetical protein
VTEWFLLIHQLPPKPDYLRVKIARRLQRIGAIAVKNTVYVLPASDQALEDLQWTVREIRDAGGEANLIRAQLVDGLTDEELLQRFNDARDLDYAPVLTEAQKLEKAVRRASAAKKKDITAAVADLRRRAEEIRPIDYFGAPNGLAIAATLDSIDGLLQRGQPRANATGDDLRGRVWVTRAGVHIDRMASAWLIRRFIDTQATFRFVTGQSFKPAAGELRFDMFDAEFSHQGDRCTFEVLLDRAAIADEALRAISEIVHDIDLRDAKFGRAETAGVAMIVNGIAHGNREDADRLRRSAELFDDLYREYSSMTRSMARRQTRQKPTSSRVNMMQSTSGRKSPRGS